jgi:hypothetical protein
VLVTAFAPRAFFQFTMNCLLRDSAASKMRRDLPRHKKQAGCSTQAQLLRIFSTIAVVELFSTSPNTFTVPP